MNRTIKRALPVLLILATGYFSLPYLNGRNRYLNYLNYIFRGNSLQVSCSKNLDIKNSVVIFENETALIQNRDPESAERMLHRKQPAILMRDTIFAHGKQVKAIPYDYGKQRLAVYYNDEYVGELCHWQTNQYHVHDYTVHLKSAKGIIVMNGHIDGPDVMYPISRR